MTQRPDKRASAPPAVIGYTRVSTRTQVESGHGLEMQAERLAAWSAYDKTPIDRIAHDDAMSGSSMEDRRELRRAFRDVLNGGPGSAFVVYKLDRLGRNALDVQETIAVLQDANVRIVSVVDGVDTNNAMGTVVLKLLTNILATFAELEKEAIVGRLQGGRRLAKEQRRPSTNETHYGWARLIEKVDGKEVKRLVPVVSEFVALDHLRALAAAGLGFNAIAEALNAAGIPARGRRWWATTVRRILTGKRAKTPMKRSNRMTRAREWMLADPDATAEAAET